MNTPLIYSTDLVPILDGSEMVGAGGNGQDWPDELRPKVEFLESEMLKMPQVAIALEHYFSKGDGHGVYARLIRVPAGTLYTGKVHKYEQLNMLLKGEASILFQDGMRRIVAPHVWVSPPGVKRIVWAHTDVVRVTIHGTDSTDLAEIEDHFIAQTDEEYLEFRKMLEDKS
jgi:hypothetical protein